MEEELKEKLFNKKDNGWETLGSNQKEEVFDLSKKYMDFLNVAKTEREFIKHARKLANENGYKDIMEFDTLKPGDKIYFVNREEYKEHLLKIELQNDIIKLADKELK